MANIYVSETSAGKSISAWVITKGPRYVATVRAHYGNSRVLVNVFQDVKAYESSFRKHRGKRAEFDAQKAYDEFAFQHASASGYGYDKFTSALSGLIIDGHVMGDHSSRDGAPKPPKGNGGLYPDNFKTPKGYSLANWSKASKETGRVFHAFSWRDLAREKLGLSDQGGQFDSKCHSDIMRLADKLRDEWEASDDCATGYSSCYKDSGLKYLEALGYKVFQAI